MNNNKRPIWQIAKEIKQDWNNIYFGAVPYLQAMECIESIDDVYGADTAKSVVIYFLCNATRWRGDKAREIKKELNNLLNNK